MSSFQLAEAASGVIRDAHYVTDEAGEDVRATRLEAGRTNSLLNSEDFSAGSWSATATVTTDDATAPDGTSTADKVDDAAAGSFEAILQNVSGSDDSQSRVASIFVKKRSSDSFCMLRLAYTGGTTNRNYDIHINAADGTFQFDPFGNATPSGGNVESVNDEWWRVWVAGANNSSGNGTFRWRFFPAVGTALGNTSTVSDFQHIWGAQLEGVSSGASFPSSYFPTTSSAGTRSADDASDSISSDPQAQTFYWKFIQRSMDNDQFIAGQRGSAAPGNWWGLRSEPGGTGASGAYRFVFSDDNGNDQSQVTLGPAYGDVVELAVQVGANGDFKTLGSLNGGTVQSGPEKTSVVLEPSWQTDNLTLIGRELGSGVERRHDHDLIAFDIASGTHTMDEMRSGTGDLYSYRPGDSLDSFSRGSVATFRQATALDRGTASTLRGNAGFKYTDPDTGATVTVQINFPLVMEMAGGSDKRRARYDSLDKSSREVYVTGSGVREVEADLRFIDTPSDVLDMLNAARNGTQIDYYHDLADSSTKHPSRLLNPEAARLQPDRDRRSHGEYETRLRLRAVSGTYDGVLNP